MITGLIELDKQERLRSDFLNYLGDASYSIYLTNLTIVSACCKAATLINAKLYLPTNPMVCRYRCSSDGVWMRIL